MRWLPDLRVLALRRAHQQRLHRRRSSPPRLRRAPRHRRPRRRTPRRRSQVLPRRGRLRALYGSLRLERGDDSIAPRLVPMAVTPPRVIPATRPLGRFGFLATFVRNPLEVVPLAAYEEDLVPVEGTRSRGAWVTAPAIIKAVLLDERDKFGKLTQIRLLHPLLGK